ncbi:DUF998 domain-containing protein [Robiginitalea sp. M366]|uniref:DUF998 domain-containing protein n=1 Tax=Robiginitalea aestuariiviva TaxID=3036903 RepID=UPI00240E7B31|nr:DUF998 domain-containing protein [Robiginitalea aestuariiviva]MDG1571148.1 DUF998 domain-containing protein [Robiginitalea aestuariiviva]
MQWSIKFYVGAYALMLAVIFILPFYSSENYSILEHTTSELGGQGMPHAWVMNVVFVLLGASSILGSWAYLKSYWIPKLLILVFGLALTGTAFYSHAPTDPAMPFSAWEDQAHSHLAKVTGFAFTCFAMTMAFILKQRQQALLAALVAVWDTVLSATMFEFPMVTGLFQRLIFMVSFGWLGYILLSETALKDYRETSGN